MTAEHVEVWSKTDNPDFPYVMHRFVECRHCHRTDLHSGDRIMHAEGCPFTELESADA